MPLFDRVNQMRKPTPYQTGPQPMPYQTNPGMAPMPFQTNPGVDPGMVRPMPFQTNPGVDPGMVRPMPMPQPISQRRAAPFRTTRIKPNLTPDTAQGFLPGAPPPGPVPKLPKGKLAQKAWGMRGNRRYRGRLRQRLGRGRGRGRGNMMYGDTQRAAVDQLGLGQRQEALNALQGLQQQYGLQMPQYGQQMPQYGQQMPQYGQQMQQYGQQMQQMPWRGGPPYMGGQGLRGRLGQM